MSTTNSDTLSDISETGTIVDQHHDDCEHETKNGSTDIHFIMNQVYGPSLMRNLSVKNALGCFKHFFEIPEELNENELYPCISQYYNEVMLDHSLRENLLAFVTGHLYEEGASELNDEVDRLSESAEKTLQISQEPKQQQLSSGEQTAVGDVTTSGNNTAQMKSDSTASMTEGLASHMAAVAKFPTQPEPPKSLTGVVQVLPNSATTATTVITPQGLRPQQHAGMRPPVPGVPVPPGQLPPGANPAHLTDLNTSAQQQGHLTDLYASSQQQQKHLTDLNASAQQQGHLTDLYASSQQQQRHLTDLNASAQHHAPFSGNLSTYPSQGIGHWTFGSPYSSVQPLSDFDTRVQTVVNECRQLRNCIQTVSTGLDRLIDDSSDTEYKKRDIEATLREFADKATDLFNKSIQCYNILQSLEHLPTHQDSARFIDETHREAEALYSRVGTASPRIHHNLKTRESAKSAIDIDDIKSQMTFPTFDGTDTISSKNIFEYFSEAEAFFEQRSTKEAIKANFIKSNLRDPALSSSKEVLANHKDYRQIKRILIEKYGRLTVMYQSLNKHHEEVGVIPSLHGNNVPWATIRKKAKKHWRLIQKGSAIEKHFADRGETFQNSYAYIGSVVNFLPTEMMTMDEVADAKDFSIIKEKFRIVLNKSETQERLCMSNAQS